MEGGRKYVRGASPELHRLAQQMRENPTPAEAALWAALSGKRMCGLRFRFQHPLGQFILDFYCASCKLALEVDGNVHAGRAEEDSARTDYLEAYHCWVIRFTNADVLANIEWVREQVLITASPATRLQSCPGVPEKSGEPEPENSQKPDKSSVLLFLSPQNFRAEGLLLPPPRIGGRGAIFFPPPLCPEGILRKARLLNSVQKQA